MNCVDVRTLNVAIAAWIGIEATLLLGGRTVHSLFKLPVPLLEMSTCNVAPTSKVVVYAKGAVTIHAEIMTGICKSKRILLPRIQLRPSNLELPFILCRQQFPIRLAYSTTIYKSQGQTFDKVGIYLQRPSHMVICMSLSQEHEFPEYKGQGSTNH